MNSVIGPPEAYPVAPELNAAVSALHKDSSFARLEMTNDGRFRLNADFGTMRFTGEWTGRWFAGKCYWLLVVDGGAPVLELYADEQYRVLYGLKSDNAIVQKILAWGIPFRPSMTSTVDPPKAAYGSSE